jgi:hypothetical protein
MAFHGVRSTPETAGCGVHLGVLPQPSATLAAAPLLQAAQEPRLAARRIPEFPCDHTGTVPVRILVGANVPQIHMPPEAINRLPAHATESRMRVCAFAIWRRRRPECRWQPAFAVIAEPPSPAAGRSAEGSKRPCQPICAYRMCAPIPIDRKPRRRR